MTSQFHCTKRTAR